MSPNKENIQKWVSALRSGKYKQGKNFLKSGETGNLTYCCMGAACEVAKENNVAVKENQDKQHMGYYQFDGEDGYLPLSQWLGLDSSNPAIENPSLDKDEKYVSCSRANDILQMTFEEIADAIEKTYLQK